MTAYQLASTQLANVPRNRVWITDGDRSAGWLYESHETERMKCGEVVDVDAHMAIDGSVVFTIVVK